MSARKERADADPMVRIDLVHDSAAFASYVPDPTDPDECGEVADDFDEQFPCYYDCEESDLAELYDTLRRRYLDLASDANRTDGRYLRLMAECDSLRAESKGKDRRLAGLLVELSLECLFLLGLSAWPLCSCVDMTLHPWFSSAAILALTVRWTWLLRRCRDADKSLVFFAWALLALGLVGEAARHFWP